MPSPRWRVFPFSGADAGVEMQLSPFLWEEILHWASLTAPADRDQPGPVPKSLVESQSLLVSGGCCMAAWWMLHSTPRTPLHNPSALQQLLIKGS